jgi:S-adenosylmethionine hydrolase
MYLTNIEGQVDILDGFWNVITNTKKGTIYLQISRHILDSMENEIQPSKFKNYKF